MSPPMVMQPEMFSNKVAYLISKYGMSMCTLGMAEEFKPFGIGVNCLWPRTLIWTAAVDFMWGNVKEMARTPEIMADSTYAILIRDPKKCSGNFYIDEDVLKEEGINDFTQYACDAENAEKVVVIFGDKAAKL
jgi:NAD(P)-dependent dehydrogenase (short-subunit alcohol dehydrogenase family)